MTDALISRRLLLTDIKDVRLIGAGSCSVVWLVEYRSSRLLASKRLVDAPASDSARQQFVNEIVVVANLEHPCIVALVGVAWSSERDLQALYEYMPRGTLHALLSASGVPVMRRWHPAKLQVVIDVIEALVYTHSFDPPLVHRSLTSKRVLLTDDM